MDGKNIKYRIGKSYVAQIVTTMFAFACVIPLLFILGLSSKRVSPRSTGIFWSISPNPSVNPAAASPMRCSAAS
jgi:hypothetical protein